MKNPNFAVLLYSIHREPQGYLKKISTYYYKVQSTNNLAEAKKYATEKTARADAELVMAMTKGGLICEIIRLNQGGLV